MVVFGGVNGLGGGLDDEEARGEAVDGPFGIDGAPFIFEIAIVIFDADDPVGELQGLAVIEAETLPLGFFGGDDFHPLVGIVPIDHELVLDAELFLNDGRVAFFTGGFEDEEFVGGDGALDDELTQSVGAVDDDEVAEASLGVEGKGDSAGCQVGADHFLYANGEADVEDIEVESLPVADGPVGEQGSKAVADGVDERSGSTDVEVGLLLAGKAGVGQVLGGGRRTDGDGGGGLVMELGEGLIGGENLMRQVMGEACVADGLADLRPGPAQGLDVVEVDAVELAFDKALELTLFEELIVGVGGDDKAPGDPNSEAGKMTDHLTEGGAFTADEGDVFEPDVV